MDFANRVEQDKDSSLALLATRRNVHATEPFKWPRLWESPMNTVPPARLLDSWCAAQGSRRMLWRGEQDAFVAWGVAEEVEGQGPARFASARRQMTGNGGEMPWVGGFAFDDAEPAGAWQGFGALRFWRPVGLLRWNGHAFEERGSPVQSAPRLPAAPKSSDTHGLAVLPKPEWKVGVRGALRAIQLRHAKKLVLARAASGPQRVDVDAALAKLLRRPGGTVFAVEMQPGHFFLGHSPERLARVDAHRVATHALAGTPMPGAGAAKLAVEHGFVVDAITQGLQAMGLAPVATAAENRKADNVEHLETRIEAAGSPHLLDVAAALHPTPAVGAWPKEAQDLIPTLDALERGWYAGAVGFMDAQGRGELAVSLRCALVVPAASWLFAGAGIVAGSDPQEEWNETEAKLQTMRHAFAPEAA